MSLRLRTHAAFAAAAALVLALAPAAALAGTSTFTVDDATLLSFLHAVTPYEMVVGQGGLSEKLRLSNPRDVTFENGKVRMKIDCRGEPFPLELVLEPVIGVSWDKNQSAFVAKIESLPVDAGPLGKVDLGRYVPAVPIPSIFSQLAGDDQVGFILNGRITSIKITSGLIQVSADLTFRNAPPPLAPASVAGRMSGTK